MYTDCQHKLLLAFLLLATACGPSSHIRQLKQEQVSAQLSLSEERELPTLDVGAPVHRDTLVVEDPQGREVIIMKAVKDENGEMVAHETLDAARVTARFRNVAERGGSVDLRFQILVPEKMQDSDWQLCFYPDLFVLEDSIRLARMMVSVGTLAGKPTLALISGMDQPLGTHVGNALEVKEAIDILSGRAGM